MAMCIKCRITSAGLGGQEGDAGISDGDPMTHASSSSSYEGRLAVNSLDLGNDLQINRAAFKIALYSPPTSHILVDSRGNRIASDLSLSVLSICCAQEEARV